MSTRKRKQQGLVILIIALFVALIAGSAGFATGYGADAAKRNALSKQVEELTASVSGTVSSAETDALKQENEELSAKVASLEAEVNSLKEENSALSEAKANEPDNNVPDTVLDPVEKPASGNNGADAADTQPVARVSIVDRITKYVILSIVVILVIMGISMFFFGKRRDDDEDYDDEEEPDEVPEIKKAPEVKAEPEVKTEADIFGDDGLKAEYERYEASHADEKEMTMEVPAIKLPAEEPEKEEPVKEEPKSAAVPDTLEELMAKSPSAHNNDE